MTAQALDLLLILHADHEQNASTSTVRLAGSTGTNPYAAISAGVSALWGPAHGGANEAVLAMLEDIGTVDNIPKFLDHVKDKDGDKRLMGFGHRVYKNFDPRAKIIREMCHKVLGRLGQTDNPLFELALRLEEIALKDEYFISRKLYPNVDFYSGVIYSALGIPRSMFTVMFAIARTAGWVAHWQEMIARSGDEDRPPAAALHGPDAARLRRDRQARLSASYGASRCLIRGALRRLRDPWAGPPQVRPCRLRARRPCRARSRPRTPNPPHRRGHASA